MKRYFVLGGLAICFLAACETSPVVISAEADALFSPPSTLPPGENDAVVARDGGPADGSPGQADGTTASDGGDRPRPGQGPIEPRFAPDGEGFYRLPWPSNARLTDDGRPSLADFPGHGDFFEWIRAEVEGYVHGFSMLPVIYVGFDTPLQTGWLPEPTATIAPDSPIQLIRLSDGDCSTRIPISMAIREESDSYIDANVLRIRNSWGTVIEPGVPHALVVLRSFGGGRTARTTVPEAFAQAWGGDGTLLAASLTPLSACLADTGISPDEIAIATVFTAQDPRIEMKALHDAVTNADAMPSRPTAPLTRSDAWSRYRLATTTLEGTVPMPVFQDGETPYNEAGGRIVFDDTGLPVVQRWEDVPIAITYKTLENPPSPRPALVFIDGTGWDRWNHVRDNWMQEALDQGYVIYGFMPQFHGGRAEFDGSTTLATFNLLNPPAGRGNFMQQVAEISYFVRVIREQLAGVDGIPEVDDTHLVYGGQSQGSLCGAIHAAVSDQFDAYVLNGVSSSFTLTMLHREDIIDFELLIRGFFDVGAGEFGLYHPALQLVQMGADTVDPGSYAPFWKGWSGNPRGNNVFVVNGNEDRTTAPDGMANLAMVSNAAPIAPPGWDIDPLGVWTGEPVALPVAANVTSYAGAPLTMATFLDGDRGHSTIYQRTRLRRLAFHLWSTARAGEAALVSDREFVCDDGADGDQDGTTDCEDSDCATIAPCREGLCDDGLDNDENGATDCADAACEKDDACAEDCTNGEDDNGDTLIDCADPRCVDEEPCRETECNDNRDGDDDGTIDCDDADCSNSGRCVEKKCSDFIDNDRDGQTDCADEDCRTHLACAESDCTDGEDNNETGLADCADPGCALDAACVRARETDCADGLDDDGDELIDCQDSDCGQSEGCALEEDCADFDVGTTTGLAVYRGTLTEVSDDHPPGDCTGLGSGENSPDIAIRWTAPAAGRYHFSTYGSAPDTVLALYPPDCDYRRELACDDDERPIDTSALAYDAAEGETVVIIVSGYDEYQEGDLLLHVLMD